MSNSSRIAAFRSRTIQSPYNKYYSPSPNSRPETELVFTDSHNFDDFDSFDDLSKSYYT